MEVIKKIKRILLLLHFVAFLTNAQLNWQAAESLIRRTVPDHAGYFTVEELTLVKNNDAFEIESKNNKIISRGNNAGSIASALYCITAAPGG